MAHHDFKLMRAQLQEERLAKTEQIFKNVLSKGVDIYNKAVEYKQADDIAQGNKAFDLWEQSVGGQYNYDYKNNPNFGDDGYKEKLLGTSPYGIREINDMNLSEGAKQVLEGKINEAKRGLSVQYDHDQMVWRNGRISSTIQSAVDISLSDRNNTNIVALNQSLGETWEKMNPNNVNLMGANGGRLEQQIYEAGAVATLRNEFIRLKTTSTGENGETLPTLSDSDYISQARENIQNQLKGISGQNVGWIPGTQKTYIDSLTEADIEAIITQGNKDIINKEKNIIINKEQITQGTKTSIQDTIQRAIDNGEEIGNLWEDVNGEKQLTNILGLRDSIEQSKASYIALAGNDTSKQKEYAKEFDVIVGDDLIGTQITKITSDISKGVYSVDDGKRGGKERLQEQINLLPDTIQKEVLQRTFDAINKEDGDISKLTNLYIDNMKTLGDGSEIRAKAYQLIGQGISKDRLTSWLYDNIEGKGGILSQDTKQDLYNIVKLADLSGKEAEHFNEFIRETKNYYKNNSKGFLVDTNGDGKGDDLPLNLYNAISNLYWNKVENDDKGDYWGEEGREALKKECRAIIQNTTIDGLENIYKGIDNTVKQGTINNADGYKLVADIRSNPLIASTANRIASSLRANEQIEIYKNLDNEKYFLNQASKVYYKVDDYNDLNEWEQLMIKSGTAIYRIEALEGRDLEQVKKQVGYDAWRTTEAVYDKQGKIRFVVGEDKDGVVSMLTPIGSINPDYITEQNRYSGIQDGYVLTFGQRNNYGLIDWNTTSDDGWTDDRGKVLLTYTRQVETTNESGVEKLNLLIADAHKRGDLDEEEKLIIERDRMTSSSNREEPLINLRKTINISLEDREKIMGAYWGVGNTRKAIYKNKRGIV